MQSMYLRTEELCKSPVPGHLCNSASYGST